LKHSGGTVLFGMTFRNVVIAVIVLWVLRPFVVGPFEPCFFTTGLLSLFVISKCQGAKRIAGAIILLVSIIGFTHDVRARIGERHGIEKKHEQIMQGTNRLEPKNATQ
jgi:hypothetical protein